jgi:spore coat protein U-like protein
MSAPAQADITGTIDATITLTAGCIVNGQSYDDGATAADFGSLEFGSHNTLFTQADAQVLNGGGGFTIQCSTGVAPTITFTTGQNDGSGTGGGTRAMAHTTAPGQSVTYDLFSDAGRTAVVPIGGSVPLLDTGLVQTVDLYGRAYGAPGLTAGTFSDVITVVVEL